MSPKHLFLDVYNDYLLYAKKKQKNQSFSTMKYKFDSHILPFFETMYMEDISSKTIIEWEDYILAQNFSNNHNKSLYYTLSGFFEYCRTFYNFDKTIISNVGNFKKKYEKEKYDFYNINEFNQFIWCVHDIVYKRYFQTLFFCGPRPGEAFAFQFTDLKEGYLEVNKTMSSHGKREITTPKTQSSIRKIAIDKRLQKDLEDLKEYYQEVYGYFKDDFYIFGGLKPLSPTTVNRYKKKACEEANLRPITLHQFRHSHATLLLQNGIMVDEVSKRLGHSKTSTTQDVYSHTDLTQEKRVLNTLNSIRFNCFSTMKYKFKSILKRLKSF